MRKTFGFLVVPDFAFYGLFPAIEALRVANYNSGQALYDWRLISVDGRGVVATNGMTLAVDNSVPDCPALDTCFVVAGNHPLDNCPQRAIQWLRRLDRQGTKLGAFDSGVFLLAAAGLLDGHISAVHWEIFPVMRDNYPFLELTNQLYNIDGRRITCAGGTSTTDLMLALIAGDHGDALAEKVARGLVHWPRRRGSERQYPAVGSEGQSDLRTLNSILELMHSTIDDPLRIAGISEKFGMSQRSLEALFRRQLNILPSDYLRNLRLKRAQEYLFYSRLTVGGIAVACGFTSPTVFCRAFKKYFGMTATMYRQQVSVAGLQRLNHDYELKLTPQIGKSSHDNGSISSG
ncbi:MAG TPA: GlxA family transcriptional regulator [Aestuariivirga sp.]|nr:GlxA family transcriptional regulator [Aestuariivirga sp.]